MFSNWRRSLEFVVLVAIVWVAVFTAAGCKTGGGTTPGTGTKGAESVVGKWAVVQTLVTTASTDPIAPQPGTQVPVAWTITQNGNQLTLTSVVGSINGMPTSDGAVFSYTSPPTASVGGIVMQMTIECHVSGPGMMYGGIATKYYGINGVGQMMPVPIGSEAWTLKAAAQ